MGTDIPLGVIDVLSLRPVRHPDLAWRSWDGEVVILAPAGHHPEQPAQQAAQPSSNPAAEQREGSSVAGGLTDGAEHDLNEVGSRIWELCDGTRSVREMAQALVEEFEVDLGTAERDAADFVADMLRQRLLLPEGVKP